MPMKPLRFHPLDYACFVSFLCYSSSAVVSAVALQTLILELRFSLGQGGLIEVSRNLLNLGVLLAGAFVAARFGKVRSLGVGSIVMGVGLACYAIAPSFGLVLLAVGVVGAGSGLVEALINPLVQDAHPGESGRYLNIVNGFWSVGVLLTVLLTGDLLTREVSWRWMPAGLSGLSILSGILFLSLRHRAPVDHSLGSRHVRRHMIEIVCRGRFWVFMMAMFLGGGVEGAFTFWTASLIELEFGGTARAGGIGTAFFASGMIAGRFGFGWLVGQQRLRRLIIGSAAAGIPLSAVVPLVPSLAILYPMLFAIGLSIACYWPSIQSYAADRMPVDSTVLFILLSCAGIPGLAFSSWLIGVLAERTGLGAALGMLAVMFGLLLVVMVIERAVSPKGLGDSDR
ncbi:MAG: MFS transporter [Phycisphaeraceae bacterium]|nr:MFS transporter [Phycisphaeraceae bacterium]